MYDKIHIYLVLPQKGNLFSNENLQKSPHADELWGLFLFRSTPHKRFDFRRINPLAVWVALAKVVPWQNSRGTTLAGASPVRAVY